MSHLKERAQKNCLNCNAQVEGRFCHICGQENIATFETAWHLVKHFFNDITHFDGKFFSTLRYLFFKPGFLSREYWIGRRASYLNPIRMYVFTSFIFFLIFFTLFNPENKKIVNTTVNGKTEAEIFAMDSITLSDFTKSINKGVPMNGLQMRKYIDSVQQLGGIRLTPTRYKNKAEYDSLLAIGVKKHNWIEKRLTYKQIDLNEKYNNNQQQISRAFVNKVMHSFPQLLFISLPIFAWLLKLLYFRKKEYYYATHAIFSIHLYVFVFINLLFIIGINQLYDLLQWNLLHMLKWAFLVYIFYYEYKSMRIFYAQGRGKTILKFISLNLLHLFVIVLLLVFFTFLSILNI